MRLFYLSSSIIGLGLGICATLGEKIKHNLMTVNAQPRGNISNPRCARKRKCAVVDSDDEVFEFEPPRSRLRSERDDIDEDLGEYTEQEKRDIQEFIRKEKEAKHAISKEMSDRQQKAKAFHAKLFLERSSDPKLSYLKRRQIFLAGEFLICYDYQTRAPCWTLECLGDFKVDEHCVDKSTPGRKPPQKNLPDRDIPEVFRTNECDYANSSNKYMQQHSAEHDFYIFNSRCTCSFANVYPQKIDPKKRSPDLQTVWDEFRDYTAVLTKRYKEFYVLTGALYVPRKLRGSDKLVVNYKLIGGKMIAIPTHFYKVFIIPTVYDKFYFQCFRFANKVYSTDDIDLRKHYITREQLEKEAGYVIFPDIKKQDIRSSKLIKGYIWNRYCTGAWKQLDFEGCDEEQFDFAGCDDE